MLQICDYYCIVVYEGGDNMNVGERIRIRRKELKMSVDKLAELIGKNRATVYRYENNDIENMPYDIIEPIAKALKVRPSYLMGWEESDESSSIHSIKEVPNVYTTSQKTVRVPILGPIACGDPILVEENYEDYKVELKDALPHGDLFFLNAKGDSMSPTIPDGSLVLIRHQKDVESGEIAAVMFNGNTEATLKRVKKQDGIIMLVPDNNKYEIMVASKENPIEIIGKAIEIRTAL